MGQLSAQFTLTADSLISLAGIAVTIVLAIIGGIYKALTDSKKYELTEAYRRELLDWYNDTCALMIQIIHYYEDGVFFSPEFKNQKAEMRGRLSALIEIGRFYFPNNIEGEAALRGSEKPMAYRGYRNFVLEPLMQFYYNSDKISQPHNISYLWSLERTFTSFIYEIVDPRQRIHDYGKFVSMNFPKAQSMEQYAENYTVDNSILNSAEELHMEDK